MLGAFWPRMHVNFAHLGRGQQQQNDIQGCEKLPGLHFLYTRKLRNDRDALPAERRHKILIWIGVWAFVIANSEGGIFSCITATLKGTVCFEFHAACSYEKQFKMGERGLSRPLRRGLQLDRRVICGGTSGQDRTPIFAFIISQGKLRVRPSQYAPLAMLSEMPDSSCRITRLPTCSERQNLQTRLPIKLSYHVATPQKPNIYVWL